MPLPSTTPAVPGVTAKAAYDAADLPCIDEALAKETPEEVGIAFADIAERTFRAWDWYYVECQQSAAMLGGAQRGYWSTEDNAYVYNPEPENADKDVVSVQANIEKRITDQATGMLVQDDPIFGYAPGTSETGDSAASKAADTLGRWIWQYHRRADALERKARGAFAYGLVPELVEWDETEGEPYIDGMDYPPPEMGEDGQPTFPEPIPRVKFAGDLRYTTLDRDQVGFDPVARHCYDGQYLVIRERVGRARAMQLYPGKIKTAKERKQAAQSSEGRERRVARYSTVSGRKGSTDDEDEDSLVLLKFFIRKSPERPFGKQIVVTDEGDFCDERDNEAYPTWEEIKAGEQQPNYHWPVVFYYGDERDNCPVGRGRVLDIHGLQKTINGDLSKGLQHRAIIGNTKIKLPKGLDVEWNDEIGQIIRFSKPEQAAQIGYVIPPGMPSDTIPAINLQRELAENIPGVNAATMGNAPSSDPSGRAISALQQRDYVGINPIKRRLYRAAATEMELSLRLFRRYATQKRKLVIVGKNGETAVNWLDRSSIAAGTDVVCFNATALPQDPEKRAMYLLNVTTMLAQLKDDNQRFFLLELLDLHDTKAWFQKQMPFRQRAVRFTERWLLGETPRLMPWDNPIIFKATIEEFVCKEEVESQLEDEMAQMEQMAAQQRATLPPGSPALPPQPAPDSLLGRILPVWKQVSAQAQMVLTPMQPPAGQGPPGASPGGPPGPQKTASTQAPPSAPSAPTTGGESAAA